MSIGTLPATGPRPTPEHQAADAEPPGCPGCSFCTGRPEPEPLPEPVRSFRRDLIRAHLPLLADTAQAMRRFGRHVTGWTLPADWNPGPAPDPFVASPYEVAERRAVEARLLALPLTFAGDRIVVHLDPAAPGEPDRLERKP